MIAVAVTIVAVTILAVTIVAVTIVSILSRLCGESAKQYIMSGVAKF
jgi:hypothetical protein